MLLLLLSYAFFATFLYLTGFAFLKASARFLRLPSPRPTFAAFWTGYCIYLGILEGLLLFSAARYIALPSLLLLAGGGFVYVRSELTRARAVFKRASKIRNLYWFVLLVAALVVSSQAVRNTELYDTYLYHANVVRWATDFGTVPGLVNLHGRLGFNSSFHAFATLLNLGPLRDRSAAAALSLLYFVALAQFALAALRLRRPRKLERGLERGAGRVRADALFALFIAPFLFTELFTHRLASLSTDHVVYLFGALLVLYLFSIRGFRPGFRRPLHGSVFTRRDVALIPTLFPIAAVAVTTKLSAIPFALIPGVFVLFLCLRSMRPENLSSRDIVRFLVFGGSLAVGLGAVHMARNVVLSGWLWYPVPLFSFYLDWSPSADVVRDMSSLIRDWARMPGPDYVKVAGNDFLFWFKPWLARFRGDKSFLLSVCSAPVIATIAIIVLARRRRGALAWLAVVMINAIGLLYFFFTAPDVRFALIWFWLPAAQALTGIFLLIGDGRAVRWAAVPAVSMLIWWSWWSGAVFHRPAGRFLRPPKLPANQLRVHAYPSGLKVYLPVQGDQCGNSPLPCAPVAPPKLMPRDPGNPAAGFRLK